MSAAIADHFRGGGGPPLLLVHGFTATWRSWGPVADALEREFDVLAPTLPGHRGGPEMGPRVDVPTMTDGVEAMLDEVEWDAPHVAGFSLGGWVALELAKRGRARSVTAFAPAGSHARPRDRTAVRRLFARNRAGARRVHRRAERLCRSPRFRRLAMRDMMFDGSRVPAEVAAEMLRDFVATPAFDAILAEARHAPPASDLDRIDVPVHLVWGEHDRVFPPRLARFFLEAMPAATLQIVPRAGHVPFWEATDAVVDAIRRGVRAAAASA